MVFKDWGEENTWRTVGLEPNIWGAGMQKHGDTIKALRPRGAVEGMETEIDRKRLKKITQHSNPPINLFKN